MAGSVGVLGFAGEYTDPNGLVHLRARPYDPGSGRFLAMDPVQPGSPGTTGWQYYAYAGNNPTTWTDPSGQAALLEYSLRGLKIGAAIGVVAAPFVCDTADNGWGPHWKLDARCTVATIAGGAFFGFFGPAVGLGAGSRCIVGGAVGAVDGYATTYLSGRGDPVIAAGLGGVLGCVFSVAAPVVAGKFNKWRQGGGSAASGVDDVAPSRGGSPDGGGPAGPRVDYPNQGGEFVDDVIRTVDQPPAPTSALDDVLPYPHGYRSEAAELRRQLVQGDDEREPSWNGNYRRRRAKRANDGSAHGWDLPFDKGPGDDQRADQMAAEYPGRV